MALAVPPIETKPFLAYLMLLVIVGGVGLACVKEGKVIIFSHLLEFHIELKCSAMGIKIHCSAHSFLHPFTTPDHKLER